uniref:ribosomal protein S3 n=1 Tax=Hormidiella parvula TaxID=2058785 RepID=UPI00286A0D88|nr:ribosomal protein S3 [Hormidiella parvula]WKT05986.1 ribosomal protein S3 [Hormidiella parvula]
MGQKIHPLGFRIGITETHRAHWFGDKSQYAVLLQEDHELRCFVTNFVRNHVRTDPNDGGIGIVSVEIERVMNLVHVKIHTVKPALLAREKALYKLRDSLKQMLKQKGKTLRLNLVEVANRDLSATSLAQDMAQRLEARVAFRRVIKKTIELAKKAGVKGIKVQVAGRLNGAEIARTEWVREGRVPLQTLRAKIDYCEYSAFTTYGVLGIKVWVFQGESLYGRQAT